jgi:hypothetical protein
MLFTEHKFSADHIAQVVAQRRQGLKANRGLSDLLGFGLEVVAKRLSASPHRYVDYGPYWWALKQVMREGGYLMGDQSDPLVANEYRGVDAVSTLIAADEFRSQNLASQMVGGNQFLLTANDPDWYVLFDSDMEGRIVAVDKN